MRLRTRLLLSLAYVLVLAIVSLQVPLVVALRDRVDSEIRSQASSQADLVASSAADLLGVAHRRQLRRLVRTAARTVHGRVIVVDRRGLDVADSAGPDSIGDRYASRPEIRSALRGRHVQERRFSQSLGEELLATAAPLSEGGRPVGVVRITQSVAAVHRSVTRVTVEIVLLGALVLAFGLAAGVLIARALARPITRLETAARQVAGGDLEARAPEEEGSAEQRSLARWFNEMTSRLARLLRAQQEFVADASHQLRTPLTGVRLRIEEAQAAGVSGAAARELEAGIAEIDRMAHIVDELLVLSRAGERDAPAREIDLGAAAERARARWEPAATAAGVTLRLDRSSPPGSAVCGSADLDRMLDALVENAVIYGAAGETVELAAGPDWIEVRDHGPGLDSGEEEQVWERFHRGGAGRRGAPGTGLGLPIARELAREWGVRATLRNGAEGGAVARLEWTAEVPA